MKDANVVTALDQMLAKSLEGVEERQTGASKSSDGILSFSRVLRTASPIPGPNVKV